MVRRYSKSIVFLLILQLNLCTAFAQDTYSEIYKMYDMFYIEKQDLETILSEDIKDYEDISTQYLHQRMLEDVSTTTDVELRRVYEAKVNELTELDNELNQLKLQYSDIEALDIKRILDLDSQYRDIYKSIDSTVKEINRLHYSGTYSAIIDSEDVSKLEGTAMRSKARLENLAEYDIGYLDTIPLPVDGRLTSGYGIRLDPFTETRMWHNGIDIAAPEGTGIEAVLGGKVITAEFRGGLGKAVIVDNGNGIKTVYGHLSNILVKKGDIISQCQLIGEVGSTGRSTGAHLHFGLYIQGDSYNPLRLLNGYREEIKNEFQSN